MTCELSCQSKDLADNPRVTVEVKGRDTDSVDVQAKPLHKKNPEIGTKQLVYSSNLIMEQEDAASFGDNEEVSDIK
jgi:glutamyl-tRNA synthetase